MNNKIVTFRLADLEKPLMDCVAARKTRASTIIREALREKLLNTSVHDTSQLKLALEKIAECEFRLSRIGGNLNQVAHHINIHGTMKNDTDLPIIQQALKQEFKTMMEELKGLGHELRKQTR